MLRFISFLLLVIVCVPSKADTLPSPLPDTIYFSVDWCPRAEELIELSKHLELTMNGCCIGKAAVLSETKSHPEILVPWEHRTAVQGYPSARCDGKVLTAQEEELEKQAYYKQKDERAEQEKLEDVARRSAAPAKLKVMPKEVLCTAYGKALRGMEVEALGRLPGPELITLVKSESGRRKLKFNDALVRKGQIKLGFSECQLYASWGFPEDQSRSVGSWGVHVQHIYGYGTYVYTENGQVKSWQN